MAEPAIEVSSTLQSASIKRSPSPRHNVNPSTSASTKQPVRRVSPQPTTSSDAEETASISSDIVKPFPRQTPIRALPDLRFEQSYLGSIQDADSWGQVAFITIRDQVMLPLLQGTLWTLALSGWRHWNRGAKLKGEGLGAKVRRWWWQVNNWAIPKRTEKQEGMRDREFAGQVKEFYVDKFSSAVGD